MSKKCISLKLLLGKQKQRNRNAKNEIPPLVVDPGYVTTQYVALFLTGITTVM